MSKTVWLITGAGRGMVTDIAKAALAAGHAVVATGRDPERVTAAIGAHDDLLAVKLDVTNPDDATAAVQAAVDRFGRVDVLVNNAGTFIAGFFEEISPGDFRAQIETNLSGPLKLVSQDEAPVRWVAGADAVQTAGNKGLDLIAPTDAYRELSSPLVHDDD
jgi:NAD(P)-dependent dehydrogenase (short-subunit alcohol dehydrogenase family)